MKEKIENDSGNCEFSIHFERQTPILVQIDRSKNN